MGQLDSDNYFVTKLLPKIHLRCWEFELLCWWRLAYLRGWPRRSNGTSIWKLRPLTGLVWKNSKRKQRKEHLAGRRRPLRLLKQRRQIEPRKNQKRTLSPHEEGERRRTMPDDPSEDEQGQELHFHQQIRRLQLQRRPAGQGSSKADARNRMLQRRNHPARVSPRTRILARTEQE